MSDLNLEGLSEAQLRLFAVRCARRVQHLMTDPRSVAALDVAERYAKGGATDDELSAALAAAWAARDASWAARAEASAARDAASAAARAVARAEVWAAEAAARDAASAASWAASWAARTEALAAAGAAELAEQQKILDEIRKEEPK